MPTSKWPLYQLDAAIDNAPTLIMLESDVEARRCRHALRRRLRRRGITRRLELRGNEVVILLPQEPAALNIKKL